MYSDHSNLFFILMLVVLALSGPSDEISRVHLQVIYLCILHFLSTEWTEEEICMQNCSQREPRDIERRKQGQAQLQHCNKILSQIGMKPYARFT